MNPDWKDKYNEYQMLMQQLQQLEQNSEIIEKHVSDLNSLKENLGNVSKVKTNTESLLPIGNGIFLRGELKDSSSVVMNVGAGVLLEKSVKEAIDSVESQLLEVKSFLDQLKNEIVNTRESLFSLQEEIQSAAQEKMQE
ncbi:MAG TPA: prefoldin subunit alpha [Candidatus Nanoarchaeia archaeon]|nr:prefoldin subunit alpha [Candidatus Nanoarchaeia archaeon]